MLNFGLKKGNMNESGWDNNKLFSSIYIVPDEVTFIKDDIHTHSQKLTIYNTTQRVLKYEIIKTTPAKVNFKQTSGVINSQCVGDIFLHLLEFPHIEANHFNLLENLCDEGYRSNLAIFKLHDKKGHLIDQKCVKVVWLRFRPSLNYKHLQLHPENIKDSSKKFIKEVEKDDFYIVNYPQTSKSQALNSIPNQDNALWPCISTKNNDQTLSNLGTSYSHLKHNIDNLNHYMLPTTINNQKSILKTSHLINCQSPLSKKRITFNPEPRYEVADFNNAQLQQEIIGLSSQNITGRPSQTINWFTVSLLSGCLIILALPSNEVAYDDNQINCQQICLRSNSTLSNSALWWSYVWPPRVCVQTKIIASYILGLITMAFLRN